MKKITIIKHHLESAILSRSNTNVTAPSNWGCLTAGRTAKLARDEGKIDTGKYKTMPEEKLILAAKEG